MQNVYKNNLWGGDESRSGRGSSKLNTQYLEVELPEVIKALKVNSILDIPCGDFAWMPRMLKNMPDVTYHGADIVEEIIAKNQRYASDRVSFSCLDITSDKLPTTDMVFVRDCFNHLPLEMVFKALNNIKKAGIQYLAVTHFNWRTFENRDIDNSQKVNWRKLNFTLEPFSFGQPLDFVVEGSSESMGKDKTTAIWKVKDLKL